MNTRAACKKTLVIIMTIYDESYFLFLPADVPGNIFYLSTTNVDINYEDKLHSKAKLPKRYMF